MNTEGASTVNHWIQGLKAHESVAAQGLWNRYFSKLVVVAQAKLQGLDRDATGEDIALSALKSVMLGIRDNRYPDLCDSSGLWPLLVTITANKAISEKRRQLAQLRTPNAEQYVPNLQVFLGSEPSPEFAAQVADELERLVLKFEQPELRTIARRKLEGFTNEEIAAELSCTKQTVIRKLNLIRVEWNNSAEVPSDSSEDGRAQDQ